MAIWNRIIGSSGNRADPDSSARVAPALQRQEPIPMLAQEGLNNYIIVILDSCRFDAFQKARPKTIMRLGELERRWSYASWTAPSHYNLLMGLLPHHSPQQVYASDYYKKDFLNYQKRLGVDDIQFKNMVPQLFLPSYLKHRLGFRTNALVSMPVLNPQTLLNKDFDHYQLMDKHNDMAAMIDVMEFPEDRPSFYLLNTGETHYPYALPTETENDWPKIHGVNGVFKHLDDQVVGGKLVDEDDEPDDFFDQPKLDELRQRQIDTIGYLDTVFERLFDTVPKNTFITVTSDHGELFGEEGYFGHGPIAHEKVFEVPFLEGKIR